MSFKGAQRISKKEKAMQYIGVRKKYHGGFGVEIRDRAINGRVWLGTYKTPVEAALVYDEAARAVRGPKTKTNFPLPHFKPTCTQFLSSGALEILKAKSNSPLPHPNDAQEKNATTHLPPPRALQGRKPMKTNEKSNVTKPWTHAFLTRYHNVGNASSDLASCDAQVPNLQDSVDFDGVSPSSTVIDKDNSSTTSGHNGRWLDLNLPPPDEDDEDHSCFV
ncbi:ethylene-responsive transcription factor 12-like [Cryptomeria japonica]|uniref:ethylene-responsive transcription factor 12-like n=1 Tax=Cryptomeria japonica TaxID=3369 RepID=UPI0027DAA053|nr:ethylene-responsive transcription factor 12-like [Cryptomeria japonica]